jgi:hypothetical protein
MSSTSLKARRELIGAARSRSPSTVSVLVGIPVEAGVVRHGDDGSEERRPGRSDRHTWQDPSLFVFDIAIEAALSGLRSDRDGCKKT